MNVIECHGLSKQYRNTHAIKDLSFTIEENKITGLIGRNSAGKTTLLKMLAGFIQPSSGQIKVFNENPFNSLKVSANMIFVDDLMCLPTSISLKEILEIAGTFYTNWDAKLAEGLFDYFSFNPYLRHNNLSKGKKSTFNMILGLAARCPLTIFDEPTTGMDAAVRKDFYRALLKDYINHPRTIILSSHLLNEIEDLLEDVLLIKEGEKLLHTSMDQLKEYAIAVSGKLQLIKDWTYNREVLHTKMIGADTSYTVVKHSFSDVEIENARLAGLDVTAVSADDVCVYLTNKTKGGIDDVFNRG